MRSFINAENDSCIYDLANCESIIKYMMKNLECDDNEDDSKFLYSRMIDMVTCMDNLVDMDLDTDIKDKLTMIWFSEIMRMGFDMARIKMLAATRPYGYRGKIRKIIWQYIKD